MPNLSVLKSSCFQLMSINSLVVSVVFVILNVIGSKILLKSFQLTFDIFRFSVELVKRLGGLPAIISFVYSVGFGLSVRVLNDQVLATADI